MSRQTITITTANGAKVRTIFSKKLFVVAERELHVKRDRATGQDVRIDPPLITAKVYKRTDSYEAARSEMKRNPHTNTYLAMVNRQGELVIRQLDKREVAERAQVEKSRKAIEKREANRTFS